MKLKLTIGQYSPLAGFVNIDPFPAQKPEQAFSEDIKVGDVFNLDSLVKDGQAEEIIADQILSLVPAPKIKDQIQHWVNKLKIGGKLTLNVPDVFQICKNFGNEQLNIEAINGLLYGDGSNPFTMKKSAVDLNIIKQLFSIVGLNLGRVRYNNFVLMVDGIKL